MRRSLPRSAALQGVLATAAVAGAAFAPPTRGPVLMIPIAGDDAAAIRVAVAHGARLLGPASGGTVLVWTDRAIGEPLLAAGVLPLAAPFAACGATPA